MSFTCEQCGERQSFKEPHRTITGRELCEVCNDRLTGMIVGAASGVSAGASTDETIARGILTAHFFPAVKRWKRRGKRA